MSGGIAGPSTGSFLLQKGQASETALVIERFSCPNSRIQQKTLSQSRIDSVNFKETKFTDCAFYHTRFCDCYFKKATFSKVKFIDCFFEHCDFDGGAFSNCDLEYSEFSLCKISYVQIEDCLPKWQNVRLRLARSLRMNAQSTGDYQEYRKFLLLELEASETHYCHMFTKYDGYYAKYRWVDRLRALKMWTVMKLDRWLWGHGEKWGRIVLLAVGIILSFALAFQYSGAQIKNLPAGSGFWTFFAFSASTFITLTYEDAGPGNALARFLIVSEGALGLLVFGFLVTALYVRVSKR